LSSSSTATLDGQAAITAAREDLAAAHRLAVRDGLNEGTWNHLSLTHPDDPDRMLITPSYTHWSQVTASNLVDVGPEYERSDDMMAWIAYRIHYPVHAARPDCAAVLHVHSPGTVALSMLEDCRLRMSEQTAIALRDRVAYNEEYDAAFNDMEQGRRIAEALGDTNTVLILRHHGAVVTGPTVADAYTTLYGLERACRAQLLARSTGDALREVPAAMLAGLPHLPEGARREFSRRHFAAMRQVLDAEDPGYAD
jgi:ribulose-5-phosphate 4-epimerase/fuculose-1-phosphate aldolase